MAKHFLERYCLGLQRQHYFCCLHNCNCLWLSLWMFKFAMHLHTWYGTAPALLFLKKFQIKCPWPVIRVSLWPRRPRDSGEHGKKHFQQVQRGDPAPLLIPGGATAGMLCAVLGTSGQGAPGEGSVSGSKDGAGREVWGSWACSAREDWGGTSSVCAGRCLRMDQALLRGAKG